VCLITFDKFLTNVKLFNVYIKVHNTTSDIGHKPIQTFLDTAFKAASKELRKKFDKKKCKLWDTESVSVNIFIAGNWKINEGILNEK
jgi:hypothetical protein